MSKPDPIEKVINNGVRALIFVFVLIPLGCTVGMFISECN